MPDFSIGVDLGGTNLRIAAIDERGTLLEKVSLGTQVARGGNDILDEMCGAIRRLSSQHDSTGKLLGIGIGVPGIIDPQTGLLREAPNLPGWVGIPVRAEIERRLGVKIVLENDANAAGLGEMWLGAGRQFQDLAIFTLGTGVGGGFIFNGKLWRGLAGMAGEFGHIIIDPEGVPCTCGGRGCLEQYASAKAIMRMASEAIDSGAAPELSRTAAADPEFSPKTVYDLAIQGDEPSRKIFQQVGRSLGIALANLVNALNLPLHVIGGGVAAAWDAFGPRLFEELQRRSMVYAATAPPAISVSEGMVADATGMKTMVVRAQLGSDAGLFGAARLPMLND